MLTVAISAEVIVSVNNVCDIFYNFYLTIKSIYCALLPLPKHRHLLDGPNFTFASVISKCDLGQVLNLDLQFPP